MMFSGAGEYWQQLVKLEYDFLVTQCEKLIIQSFRASVKYNKSFSAEIAFRTLQFTIYNKDGVSALYSSILNDDYLYFALDRFLPCMEQHFAGEILKTSSNFDDYSCILLAKSLTCLKEYFAKLKEHSN